MADSLHAPSFTLRQLEYAVAVDAERHFGRAAERCAVSQPGLSSQVQALEDHLGVTLFERSSRGVTTTAQGRQIVRAARALLRDAAALQEVATPTDPLAGQLRIGVIPTVGPYLLPRFLAALRSQHTGMQPLLEEAPTEVVLERLLDGELDLVVLATPVPALGPASRSRGWEVAEVGTEPFVLATPAEHPLADRHRVRVRDLADATVLLLDQGHCLRDHVIAACSLSRDDERARAVRGTSLHTIVEMVAAGVGVTLLPASATAAPQQDPRLRLVPFVDPVPSRGIGVVQRRGGAHPDLAVRVASLLAPLLVEQAAAVSGVRSTGR